MADSKRAILVISFGTSYEETREKTIGAIERSIATAFPTWEVRRAFTSSFIIKKILRDEGVTIDSVDAALARAAADGITHLLVQPTHMMNGGEYEKLAAACREAEGAFENLQIAAPLLTAQADFDALTSAITAATAAYDDGKTAICFMGHGTTAESNHVYAALQASLHAKGFSHYYIGTVEATPTLEDLLAAVGRTPAYHRVVLQPLMIVAGDHAINDMAGEEDSWKSAFAAAGYETVCILEGLGQNEAVQQMYARHAEEAMALMGLEETD